MLETKWLIVNHPILKDQVDFEEAQEQPDGILVRTPMVSVLRWTKRNVLYEKELIPLDMPSNSPPNFSRALLLKLSLQVSIAPYLLGKVEDQ